MIETLKYLVGVVWQSALLIICLTMLLIGTIFISAIIKGIIDGDFNR